MPRKATQSAPEALSSSPVSSTDWTPNSPPEQHPLWAEEVELERLMLKAGADAFRDRVIEAERKGQLHQLSPMRNLLVDWLPDLAGALRKWLADMDRRKGGPTPVALPYLKAMDAHVAVAIGLREVLDSMAINKPKLMGIALRIGRLCEHEQQVRMWEKREPALYQDVKREQDRNRATASHRRRVNINRFNALLAQSKAGEIEASLEWANWGQDAQFRVGVAILDTIVRTTGWFEMVQDPDHTYSARGKPNSPQYLLLPKPAMAEWMHRVMSDAELASPEFKPTIMPPKRWEDTRHGGYWTPYVRSPRLVRFKASQESQKERAADEYDSLAFDKVLDAVHTLQETPYRVNTRVLDVAVELWSKDPGIAGLPLVSAMPLPPRTPRMVEHAEATRTARTLGLPKPPMDEATREEVRRWKMQATPVHRFNAKRVSRLRSASSTILIAQEYRDRECFYFPHMLDFRGRIYPIPSYLQPQGNDLARGLLTYYEEVPITEGSGGDGWLAIHLANCWGNDKVDYDERISWVSDREDLWRRIAADPMTNLEWTEADKPWQTLAAIFEWVGFLDAGYGFMSSLPIMVDGTCNGIQHLSALTRDEVSGRLVNLLPGDKPNDIYKYVAERLQETVERIAKAGGAEGAKARYWLDLCNWAMPRGLTKRQVMVLPYGATKDAYYKYTRAWMDENDPIVEDPDATKEELREAWEDRTAKVTFLVTHMWDAVNATVRGGLQVMDWLQKCAKVAAVDNQPIYWVVPSGFVVRHFYGLDRMVRCDIMLDDQRYTMARAEKTAKLSTKEQLQGISPNFIHSLDASALVDCIVASRQDGIRSITAIHDSYGTHAANMWPLAKHIREAFVATHEVDVLGNFRAACQRVLVDHYVTKDGMDPFEASQRADENLPPPLDMGTLDLHAVLQSDYFFA